MERTPGRGRYARRERERRWLASERPANAGEPSEIVDRYLVGTTLRLRRAETPDGVVFKLAQKVRLAPADPERVQITNTYLTSAEYELLSTLPHREVTKTRWHAAHDGRIFAIDEFGGRHTGLVLTEVELEDAETVEPPPWATTEVTHDDRYSGGALAAQ